MTKRRKFSPEFKVRVVLELISGEKGLMQASREYEIKDSVLSRWKQEFLERAPQLFEQRRLPQAHRTSGSPSWSGWWVVGGCTTYVFKGGKIAASTTYWDMVTLLTQLGLMPGM